MASPIIWVVRHINGGIGVQISNIVFSKCALHEEESDHNDGYSEHSVCCGSDNSTFLFHDGALILLHMGNNRALRA
ncbi:hypothetical protein D3C75_1218460 [compost metagenome]